MSGLAVISLFLKKRKKSNIRSQFKITLVSDKDFSPQRRGEL